MVADFNFASELEVERNQRCAAPHHLHAFVVVYANEALSYLKAPVFFLARFVLFFSHWCV